MLADITICEIQAVPLLVAVAKADGTKTKVRRNGGSQQKTHRAAVATKYDETFIRGRDKGEFITLPLETEARDSTVTSSGFLEVMGVLERDTSATCQCGLSDLDRWHGTRRYYTQLII